MYGVATNDLSYKETYNCRIYKTWTNMLKRCYSDSYHKEQPSYIGCTVCDDWLVFSKFKQWMSLQDYESKQLDKDLKVIGNKEYSPDTCLFLSREINSLLIKDRKRQDNDLPQGISRKKGRGVFRARLYKQGNQYHLGHFKNVEDAEKVYKEAKQNYLLELSQAPENKEISQYLINYSRLFI